MNWIAYIPPMPTPKGTPSKFVADPAAVNFVIVVLVGAAGYLLATWVYRRFFSVIEEAKRIADREGK